MRKIIAGILGIAVAGFALSVFSVVSCLQRGKELDQQSKAYVDAVVPKVCTTWATATIVAEATSELTQAPPDQPDLGTWMDLFRERLGAMKEYLGSEGTSMVFFHNGKKRVTARYLARATFEKGKAEIRVQLTQTDSGWKLSGFHVNSPAVLGLAAKPESVPIKPAEPAAAYPVPAPSSAP